MSAEWPYYARFRPIQQWPGETTRSRRQAQFSAKWASTLTLLSRELDHLGRKNVVVQVALEDRDIRNDGYPRANARPAHPGVIVSLDSKYGPLSYPCDTFTTWQDNLRGIALALESLRAVDRYGVTKRGEQYTGWKQLGGGTPMAAPMTVEQAAVFFADHVPGLTATDLLDAPAAHQQQFVDSYYRVIAKALHPDTGGSTEEFQRLQEAKQVLDGAR